MEILKIYERHIKQGIEKKEKGEIEVGNIKKKKKKKQQRR